MVATVTQLFKDTWKRKTGGRQTTRVRYKRRYWDATASPPAMAYEADWHELRRDEYQTPIKISQSLDQPFQNVIRITEVSLRLYNPENKWLYFNEPPSVFCGDDVAPDGYPPVRTLFEISDGFIYTDGTREYVKRFVGVLKETPKPLAEEGIAVATIASMAYRLEKSDSSQICDIVTEETTVPPSGDGVITEFLSQTTGIDHLIKVETTNPNVSPETYAEAQQGDWEVSDTNTLKPAKITFTGEAIPVSGSDIRVSGVAWKKNLTIDEIADLIFLNAGFSASEYEVRPVLFPGGLSARRTWDEQAEWEAGSLFQDIDTGTTPGSIKRAWDLVDDFSGSGMLPWAYVPNQYSGQGSGGVSGGYLYANGYAQDAWGSVGVSWASIVSGIWSFKIKALSGTTIFHFVCNGGQVNRYSPYGIGRPRGTGYGFGVDSSGNAALYRNDTNQDGDSTLATIWSGASIGTGWQSIRIVRDSSGNVTIYHWSGSSWDEIGSVLDNSYVTSSHMFLSSSSQGGSGCLDDLYYSALQANTTTPESSETAIFETEEFDLLATPTALGILERTLVLNGGAVSIYTAFGAVSGALDAFVAIDTDGQMLSTPGRYGKIRVAISSAAFATSPEVRKLVANFTVTTVNISLAMLGDKDGLTALERYVQIPDYELAINSEGKIFIRPKSTSGSPAVELDQDNGIIEVIDYDPGESRIINAPKVRYNEYVEGWDCAAAAHLEPTSETIYGRSPGDEEDFSDIMLANDVNLARARVQGRFDSNYRAKPTLTLRIWDVPWLELSDMARLRYFDDPKMAAFFAGDPLQKYASSPRVPGSVLSALAASLDCKVVELDPSVGAPNQCIVKLEKILS